MKEELREYSEAFEAHHQAMREEVESKQMVKSTRYRLQKAREALRAKEDELLEDTEVSHFKSKK